MCSTHPIPQPAPAVHLLYHGAMDCLLLSCRSHIFQVFSFHVGMCVHCVHIVLSNLKRCSWVFCYLKSHRKTQAVGKQTNQKEVGRVREKKSSTQYIPERSVRELPKHL